jgi:hypothetical protein
VTNAIFPDAQESDTEPSICHQRNLLKLWLVLIGLLATAYAYVHTHRPWEWFEEDWLINYQAGFIRRGLYGEFAHFMHRLLGINPIWFVFLVHVACYGGILYSAYLLLRGRAEWSLWTWALIVSPVTFSFQVVDPVGGFRKEILFLAGLSALFVLLRRRASDGTIATFLALWLPFTILTHEGLFAYLGYYVAALVLGGLSWRRIFRVFFLSFVLSVVALVAVSMHHGSAQMAAQICSTLNDVEPAPCGGAVKALGETMAQGHEDLLLAMQSSNYWLVYAVTGLLAVFPIAVILGAAVRAPKTRRQAYVLCVAVAVAQFLSLPSYIYAMDWGRWIYIQVFTITLFLIFLDWDHNGLELPLRMALVKNGPARWLACAALVVYAMCWNVPHHPAVQHFGMMDRVHGIFRRVGYLQKKHHILR